LELHLLNNLRTQATFLLELLQCVPTASTNAIALLLTMNNLLKEETLPDLTVVVDFLCTALCQLGK
jgi:hypothetical protein